MLIEEFAKLVGLEDEIMWEDVVDIFNNVAEPLYTELEENKDFFCHRFVSYSKFLDLTGLENKPSHYEHWLDYSLKPWTANWKITIEDIENVHRRELQYLGNRLSRGSHERWLDEPLEVFHGKVKELDETLKNAKITKQHAREIIEGEFGFRMDLIRIYGQSYYCSTDYNRIVFEVCGYRYLFQDGSLYDIVA